MTNQTFKFYSLEFYTEHKHLKQIASRFSDYAEIVDSGKESNKVTIQFVSTASSDDILRMCDDYKKEIEPRLGTRLVYKITSTVL